MTALSRGFRGVFVVLTLSLATLICAGGCGLLGKKGGDAADAEAEAAVAEVAEAAPPPVATPAAANENDVSRFPDEKKIENVTATILRPTNVREIPSIGKVVATLAKGGTVTQIASRTGDKFFLVVFQKPGDTKNFMGWVGSEAFTAAPDAGLVLIKCVLPETALVSDSAFCGKVCTQDIDCPTGQACKGNANQLLANGTRGALVNVCTVFGAPRVVPAVILDAAPPPPVAQGPLPPAPPNVAIVAQNAGRCPPGFFVVNKDGQCHRKCQNAAQCPAGSGSTKCISCTIVGGTANVCAPTDNFCK